MTNEVKTLKNFIGGQWVEPSGDESIAVPNPATGENIAQLRLSVKMMSQLR